MRPKYRLTKKGKVILFSLLFLFFAVPFALNIGNGRETEPPAAKASASDQVSQPKGASAVPEVKPADSNSPSQQPEKKAEVIKIYFDPADSKLSDKYREILDKVAMRLISTGDSVLIEGVYNASPRSIGKNYEEYSKERGEVVYNYLLLKGVPADKMKLVNAGGTKQENRDSSEEEMKKNRRTDITFMTN